MTNPSSDSPIQPLSPALSAIVVEMESNVDSMVSSIVELIRTNVSDYASLGNQEASNELRESITANARLLFRALITHQPLSMMDAELAAAFSRSRVHQGISLTALLRAYQIGVRGFWEISLKAVENSIELQQELLFKVTRFLLHHVDAMAQAIARSYNDEQLRHALWRDRLRHELFRLISTRSEDVERFRTHAESLGLDAAAPHCAIAFKLNLSPQQLMKTEDIAEQMVPSLARVLGFEKDRLMRTLYHDHLVAWIPVPSGLNVFDFDRHLAEKAEELASNLVLVQSVGVGLLGVGPRGWRASMDQAIKVLDVGVRFSSKQRVFLYSTFVLDDAVSAMENVPRYFETVIERLSSEANLLETLVAYFEFGQHRKVIAGALNIHPNSLDKRLERIEQVLNGTFDDVGWLARVYTALRIQKVRKDMRSS